MSSTPIGFPWLLFASLRTLAFAVGAGIVFVGCGCSNEYEFEPVKCVYSEDVDEIGSLELGDNRRTDGWAGSVVVESISGCSRDHLAHFVVEAYRGVPVGLRMVDVLEVEVVRNDAGLPTALVRSKTCNEANPERYWAFCGMRGVVRVRVDGDGTGSMNVVVVEYDLSGYQSGDQNAIRGKVRIAL